MKILVTGGCGFIGHALSKRLLEEGHEVHIVDNMYIGREAKIAEGCKVVGGDIREMESIVDRKYDLIFHLAAFSRVEISYQHQYLTFSVNVDGTKSVLDYANRNGSKVIFAGSSSIHHSISPYSSSKRMAEELCRFYRDGLGMDITIVRFYNVYGPGELVDSDMAALIGKWRKQVRDGERITIQQLGLAHRAFTHIDDTIDGLIKVMNTKTKNYAGWEMGNKETYSVMQVFKMFEEKFGKLNPKYVDSLGGNYKWGKRPNDNMEKLNWYPMDKLKQYINNL